MEAKRKTRKAAGKTSKKSSRNSQSPDNAPEAGTSTNKKFTKREIVSNWQKYDESNLDAEANEQLSAADFSQLLETPSSTGGHFVFASEQSWSNSERNDIQMEQINVAYLRDSLLTIPFYVRQNYGKRIFTAHELKRMNVEASVNERRWLNSKIASMAQREKKLTQPKVETDPPVESDMIPNNDEEGAAGCDDDLEELFQAKACVNAAKTAEQLPAAKKLPEAKKTTKKPKEEAKGAGWTAMSRSEALDWFDSIIDN